MTDIKNITEELKNTKPAYQESLQNSRFKAGFLGRISHEIRSPLSSLMSLHQLIISELLGDIQEIMVLQAANRNLKLKLEEVKDNVIVNVDREKLTNILFFLLEVVIDYSQMGGITLTVVTKEDTRQAIININFPSQHLTISENIDLIKLPIKELKQLNSLPQLSNGMKIILGETLLEMMEGKLVLNSDKENDNATQWQIFLPLETL